MINYKKFCLFMIVCAVAVLLKMQSGRDADFFSPTELVFKTIDEKYLKLDVYFPRDTLKKHRTLIYFHGGSWVSGTKKKVLERYRNFAVKTLTESGIEIISVDYRLIRRGYPFETCLEDCRDAVNFCVKNADYLKIDTSQLGLWGSSAGAHLALLNYAFFQEGKIKFIADDFAPTDIFKMWSRTPEWFRKQISTFFYSLPEKSAAKFDSLSKVYSPVCYAEKLKKIPILISHGTTDKIVSFSQSETLRESLDGKCVFYSYNGLGHGFKQADSAAVKSYAERLKDFVFYYNYY